MQLRVRERAFFLKLAGPKHVSSLKRHLSTPCFLNHPTLEFESLVDSKKQRNRFRIFISVICTLICE